MKNFLTAVIILLLANIQLTAQPAFFSLDKKKAGGYFASPAEYPALGIVLWIARPGEDPSGIFPNDAVMALAREKKLVLVGVAHPGPYLLTPSTQRFLGEVLRDACKEFGTPAENIAVAGIREGGLLAMQYAQECWAKPALYPYRPRAILCQDTPVDLKAWWESCARDLHRNISAEAVAEAKVAARAIAAQTSGAPDTLAMKSPFLMEKADTLGKEQFLLPVALTLYYSSDIQFQVSERGRDLYDLPIGPATRLIEKLIRYGHPNASVQLAHTPESAFQDSGWIYWLEESLFSPSTGK